MTWYPIMVTCILLAWLGWGIYLLWWKDFIAKVKEKKLVGEGRRKSREKVVKKVLGKDKTLDDLARIAITCCGRHEGDCQTIWYCMNGTEEFLRDWLRDIQNCGACGFERRKAESG